MECHGEKLTKFCRLCKKTKPIGMMRKRKDNKDGYDSRCKECVKAYSKAYHKTDDARHNLLVKRYGITLKHYNDMCEQQDNKCGICNNEDKEKAEFLCVDHCHNTNKVRGLLCTRCNRALGQLGDDLESILKVVEYLKSDNLSFMI